MKGQNEIQERKKVKIYKRWCHQPKLTNTMLCSCVCATHRAPNIDIRYGCRTSIRRLRPSSSQAATAHIDVLSFMVVHACCQIHEINRKERRLGRPTTMTTAKKNNVYSLGWWKCARVRDGDRTTIFGNIFNNKCPINLVFWNRQQTLCARVLVCCVSHTEITAQDGIQNAHKHTYPVPFAQENNCEREDKKWMWFGRAHPHWLLDTSHRVDGTAAVTAK